MFESSCEVALEIIYDQIRLYYAKNHYFCPGCKINQIMEFGDIIYFILLVFFMILGFFNDSRKKKNQQKQQSAEQSRPYFDEPEENIPSYRPEPRALSRTKTVPPTPSRLKVEEGRTAFQSSMELTTDFAKESSLKSSIFVFDADSSYDLGSDSVEIADMMDTYLQKSQEETNEDMKSSFSHHLIFDLLGNEGRQELKKGLIYGEIMQRKY